MFVNNENFKERCFFVLSRVWDKEKILSPHEETNLRHSHSALRCYAIEAQRLHNEWGLLWSSYFLFVLRSWQDEKTSFFISLPSLELTYHLSYFYLMKTLFLEDTNPYRITNYALNVSIVRKFFCVSKASLVWHKGLDEIRRFVCQSKYFVSSFHRKKRVTLLYQLSCSFEHELNCLRFVEELY